MSNQRKPYVKPNVTIIPTYSLQYNEIMALLIGDIMAKEQENIPPPTKSK